MKYKVMYQTTLGHWRNKRRKSVTVEAESEFEAEEKATEKLKQQGIDCRSKTLANQLLQLEVLKA